MKYKIQKSLGAAALSLILSSTANAAIVTVDWSGMVTSTPIDPVVAIGDAITGSFSYDNTTVGGIPLGPTAFSYSTNHISSFLVNSLSGSRDDQNIVIFDNSGGADGVQSRGLAGGYTGSTLASNSVTQIFIQFGDTSGAVFSGTTLPSTLNDANFDLKSGFLSLSGFSSTADRINFNVTSFTTSVAPVPVPAAVWLMGSALAGLVGFKRKKAA